MNPDPTPSPSASSGACPDDDTLRAAFDGAESASETVETHLSTCEKCRARMEALAEVPGTIGFLAAGETHAELDTAIERLVADGRPAARITARELSARFAAPEREGSLGRLGDDLEILEIIGQGGMGVVLRALDTALDREVAVKLLHPAFAENADLVRRFREEARAVAALDHENVVPIHRVAEHAGLPYLVMPLARGASLARRIREHGRPAFPEALRLSLRAARALAAAHAAGIVHRDVKPGNLLLGGRGGEDGDSTVWLTDFGLASRGDRPGSASVGGGTPGYLAPEVLAGHAATERSDLFALGCLFADLAGEDAPSWFRDLAGKLSAASPSDRPPSAGAVASGLEKRAATLERAPRRRRTAIRAVGIAVFAVLLAGGVAVSDLTGQTNWVNRAVLGLRKDAAFTVRGKFGVHATLAGAVAAAPDGGRVEIHRPGPFAISPLGLEGRSVAIRAAPNLKLRPRLVAQHRGFGSSASLWVDGGDLTLAGIEVVQDLSENAGSRQVAPLIRLKDGSLSLRDCVLERAGGDGGEVGAPVVLLHSPRSVEIVDCRIASAKGSALAIRAEAEGEPVDLTFLHGRFEAANWLDIGMAGNTRMILPFLEGETSLRVSAVECDIRSPDGLAIAWDHAQNPLRLSFRSERCRFEVGDFIRARAGAEQRLPRVISLRDRGSLFASDNADPEAAAALWRGRWGDDSLGEGSRWVKAIE
ncbi:MAG: serine/threonine protein kinase [Akkermansiaceae bacterium]|nr:serine/threonine protein kinase [Akkermansiaceae bacterium]